MRAAIFAYGIVCYVVFLASFLYAIGFVGNFAVPKTIDSGTEGPLGPSLLIDVVLLGLFAAQHSVMARPGFKQRWTKIVPAPAERSTYVLLSSLLLLLLYGLWQPLPASVWSVENTVGVSILWGLFALGWLTVLASTFMIDHFDLFGLRQVWLHLQEREYTPPPFQETALYRYVRHPIMLGFAIAFWATPQMSVGHLLFSVATTGYILIGVTLEERDLVRALGETYERYRRKVPMLLPGPRPNRTDSSD